MLRFEPREVDLVARRISKTFSDEFLGPKGKKPWPCEPVMDATINVFRGILASTGTGDASPCGHEVYARLMYAKSPEAMPTPTQLREELKFVTQSGKEAPETAAEISHLAVPRFLRHAYANSNNADFLINITSDWRFLLGLMGNEAINLGDKNMANTAVALTTSVDGFARQLARKPCVLVHQAALASAKATPPDRMLPVIIPENRHATAFPAATDTAYFPSSMAVPQQKVAVTYGALELGRGGRSSRLRLKSQPQTGLLLTFNFLRQKLRENEFKTSDPFVGGGWSSGKGALRGDFDGIIGLAETKDEFRTLRAAVTLDRVREALYLTPSDEEAKGYHLVFSGPPGTAKTTFARIAGQMYKELGILKKGTVKEVTRSDLVANYLGQTATKTQNVIKEAQDGVLFIDEAYTLYSPSPNDYGREALAELLKVMEDKRGSLVVIMAGYPDEMDNLVDLNPGLRSRVRKIVDFPAYSKSELKEIWDQKAQDRNLIVTDEAHRAAERRIAQAMERDDRTFGNGRFVRALLEGATDQMAMRLMEEGTLNDNLVGNRDQLRRIFSQNGAVNAFRTLQEADVRKAKVVSGTRNQKMRIGFGPGLSAMAGN